MLIEEVLSSKLSFYLPIIANETYERINEYQQEFSIIGAQLNREPVGIAIAKTHTGKSYADFNYILSEENFAALE